MTSKAMRALSPAERTQLTADVVIIGLGAGGSMVFHDLVRAGEAYLTSIGGVLFALFFTFAGMKLDVTQPAEQEALFAAIAEKWGKLDFLLHSIAFGPSAD